MYTVLYMCVGTYNTSHLFCLIKGMEYEQVFYAQYKETYLHAFRLRTDLLNSFEIIRHFQICQL
jgi:hypothetical protein